MKAAFTVVRAAAGCGKTTDLACRYLDFLAAGVSPDQAIAITFTRKAAAELEDRVALALTACLGDGSEASQRALERLGSAGPLYLARAPRDPAVVRAALAALPDAPIGTTDSFVQRLLTEFALDAALPLPDGRRVPLDLPIQPTTAGSRALQRAARRLLDPPDGSLDPDVAQLVRYFSLDELLPQIARRSPYDDLRLATSTEVLGQAARWMAEELAALDLAAIYEVVDPIDEAAWVAALTAHTNKAGRWAVPTVARWLASARPADQVPFALCGWLQGLERRGARKQIQARLEGANRSFGPGDLSLWQVVQALRYPYDDPAQVELADALRQARLRLRRAAVTRGLEEAALGGELGHGELIEVAIALCEDPPDRLVKRFRALLVDEVQDADPGQVRLYCALATLGDRGSLDAYFVGDARQSIFLFRGAEPEGIRLLERQGEQLGQGAVLLETNRRSAPLLVAAQRALFDALDGPMRAQRWSPIASLAKLLPDPDNATLALSSLHHAEPAPVWIVVPDDDETRIQPEAFDRRVLWAFHERLVAARAEGRGPETAAVLTATWRLAQEAAAALREWGGPEAAFVDGRPGQQRGHGVTDLSLWIRALLDPSDDLAWFAVFKHPSVGLSDAALARAAAGVGLRPALPVFLQKHPGRWLAVEAFESPHDPLDILAFDRARGPLIEAASDMGRKPTAALLDALFHALDWRTVLAAGPGGEEDVVDLDVLLDWIRDQDASGLGPDAILEALANPHADLPHLHLERPAGSVSCTTVYQAKGLAWDHVAVLRPGRPARERSEVLDGWMDLGGERVRLEGLRFDPTGGVAPFEDPLGRLARRLHELRTTEESARLLYVATTRARRSVTLGFAPESRKRSADDEVKLSTVVSKCWCQPANFPPNCGIAWVPRPEAPPASAPPLAYARPTGADIDRAAPPPPGWEERAPSSVGAHLDSSARDHHADAVLHRIRLANGWSAGGTALHPPGTASLAHLTPTDWGQLAHGWLAAWAFAGEPDPAHAGAYLRQEWGADRDDVRGWLIAMSHQLAQVGGPLWDWVTEPSARLHFEHPLLGLGRQHDQQLLLSGRVDLLVETKKRLVVIDFKAGAKIPTGYDDLVDGASLRTYAFQLHAYADALRLLGRPVDAVALWFLRSGTSVYWTP